MELRATREMRRNTQLDKLMGRKAEASDASAKAQTPQMREPADKLSISAQALSWVDEQNRKLWEWNQERDQRRQARTADSLSALESAKHQLDSMEKNLDMMNKCQKIAAAIMRGDRVPKEDMIYLMNHDREGYKMALALRRPKKDPKDVESVLDEEDRNGGQTKETGGGEAPSAEAAGASEGGGGASASEK